MNNLVFNNVASLLKTTIYAQNPSGESTALRMDLANNLLVSIGSGTVEISNASLTVAGTVTVSEITAPVTIGNASLTVAGTVTVSEITAPVTIGNASLTVTVAGSGFASDTVANQTITGTGVLFDNTDISGTKVASIFLYNEGATPITLSLQISPVDSNARYLDDPSYTDQVVPGNGKLYIPITNFAHYARLQYNMAAASGTISAYLNTQA